MAGRPADARTNRASSRRNEAAPGSLRGGGSINAGEQRWRLAGDAEAVDGESSTRRWRGSAAQAGSGATTQAAA
ncbi:hypothetical protein Syun_028936 [Stephania yunnanensis]|uniref:Uncharacterized protein n=1 Tax=Stephania yunnanensis TaxID=152371 RepID=A0AAP0E808_9MAGN